jgi:predicted nucleic acid-binding protein
VRFWDTSALVPALVAEPRTDAVEALLAEDPGIGVWWATEVECASAIARLERREALSPQAAQAAFERLDGLAAAWMEVQPGDRLRTLARRLLRVHPLGAADALQLAAALETAEGSPAALELVTADDRLALAARREGLGVSVPGAPAP